MVGRAFALRLTNLGHDVRIGTRVPSETIARTEPDSKGIPAFRYWAAENPDIKLVTMAEASQDADLIINATEGTHTLSAFQAAGKENLDGKIILDLALPLSFSPDRPPHLSFANDDSLGERLQRMLPTSHVVKSLNTMAFPVMLNPEKLPGHHNVFVSGNSLSAKKVVSDFLRELGWPDDAIIDLGDLITARSTEMYANLLFNVSAVYGTYEFNIAIIRNIS